uniref:Fibronectin type-III domain-containing protein n=1 Tax=Plectus sambesii TaxID=2011161 RepID=A0A914UUK7_9BILA
MESVDETVEPVREFWVQYQIDPKTEGSVWRTHPTPVTAAGNERIEDGQRLVEAGVTVDLQPFGQYKFRVIARNDVGDSAPAEVNGECETPAKVPDRNPTGVSAKGSTPEDLVVYWQPMAREEWNGPDFHYIIKYRKADGSDGSEWKEVKVEDPYADHHAIDVGEDGAYVPYEVQVQAVNKEGHASVQPETVKGRSGEGKPTAVVSGFKVLGKDGTTAEFSWNPVDRNDVQGEFKGYKIIFWYEDEEPVAEPVVSLARRVRRKRAEPGERQEAVFSPDATQGVVYGLQPNKVNYAMIVVMNGQNDGPPSEIIHFMMPEGVPTPVRHFTAFPMNPKKGDKGAVIGLTWKIPRSLNGNLIGYMLEWCKIANGQVDRNDCPEQQVTAQGDQKVVHYRVTDLEFKQDYRFFVKGVTNGGEGDPNSADASTVPQDVPHH